MTKLTTCLWFDGKAEEAANFYVSIFPSSKVGRIARYGEAGPGPAGQVLTVEFELDGAAFVGLNGGPQYQFSPAISFQIDCADQAEVDRYWDRLLEDGGKPVQCGWLTDRFGVSWQVVPSVLPKLIGGPDKAGAERAMQAMLKMVKLDIAELQRAYEGR